MLEIGSIIDGKYKILNKIGQGGMSIVYLAMNERANKRCKTRSIFNTCLFKFTCRSKINDHNLAIWLQHNISEKST